MRIIERRVTGTVLASASLLAGCLSADAAIIPMDYGAGAYAQVYACPIVPTPVYSCSLYGGVNPVVVENVNTRATVNTSLAEYESETRYSRNDSGISRTRAELSGSTAVGGSDTVAVPVVKAQAYAPLDGRSTNLAWAIQQFVYDGVAPATKTVSGRITYSQSGPSISGETSDLVGQLVAFTIVGDGPALVDTSINSVSPWITNFDATLGVGTKNSQFLGAVTDGTLNIPGFSFTLNPGDRFWIRAQLSTRAYGGGFADAFNTLTMAFDDYSGLRSIGPGSGGGPSTVPEPGSLILLGLGLAGLGLSRRRKA